MPPPAVGFLLPEGVESLIATGPREQCVNKRTRTSEQARAANYRCAQTSDGCTVPPMEGNGFVLCPLCGDRIGVYEPMVTITPYGARGTSRAREPLLPQTGAIVLHRSCYGIEPYERGENA